MISTPCIYLLCGTFIIPQLGLKYHLKCGLNQRFPNIAFCQKNGIRISGPRLGRPAKNEEIRRKDAKTAAQDNADRIQIERYFSTAKRRNGMGLITKKREDTSLTTIALSVLVTNIFGSFKLAVEESEIDSSTTA